MAKSPVFIPSILGLLRSCLVSCPNLIWIDLLTGIYSSPEIDSATGIDSSLGIDSQKWQFLLEKKYIHQNSAKIGHGIRIEILLELELTQLQKNNKKSVRFKQSENAFLSLSSSSSVPSALIVITLPASSWGKGGRQRTLTWTSWTLETRAEWTSWTRVQRRPSRSKRDI